ncbi:MAG: type II toxin-antitoxin system RelB/DinJ family antitoxin [Defluviitaleaceae bacterium]|nr:type II toxin-antitoxin system RelB/DinJ family antitoxin [Defluviitaleaceae bacterium]
MASASVTFRIDEELKKQAENMFEEMGINMTTALNAFIKATVRDGKIPFELVSEEYAMRQKIHKKLEESEAVAADAAARRYTHEEIFAPLRERYGYDI